MTQSLLSTGDVAPAAIAPSDLQQPCPVAQPVTDKARLYQTLDGVRGVAALAIAWLHFEVLIGTGLHALLPSAYLAVDLFFMLSGFVLEHAYGARFAKGLGVATFLKARYVRLYPLYVLGALIGIASGLMAYVLHAGELNLPGLGLAAIAALLMLPSPTGHQLDLLYPLNVPGWSLFFELIINAGLALTWRRLSAPVLALVLIVSAPLLIFSVATHGSADLGASWSTFWCGFPRVTFSFALGVLVYRLTPRLPKVSAWAGLVPLLALAPFFVAAPAALRPWFDLACIGLVFPAVISLGARLEPATRMGATAFTILGVISYPLYAIHYPIMELTRRVAHSLHLSPTGLMAVMFGVVLLAGLSVFSFLLARFYDAPARATLGRFLGRQASSANL
jgi:peptidoglycan/LPS O-acetylase OafA/YrhL